MPPVIPNGYRLKTDEEFARQPVRPWIFGCGDVVDDGTPRKYAWLYKPCCRNPRLDDDNDDTVRNITTEAPVSNV